MTAAPVKDRVKKLREARRDAGLVRIELWVPRTLVAIVRSKVADIIIADQKKGTGK